MARFLLERGIKMKLADLKRIPVGTKLVNVRCLLGAQRKEREVYRVHSNSIEFIGEGLDPGITSWLYFPKAKDFVPTEKGFQILENGQIAVEYEFA